MGDRKWEELDVDCLVNIFEKVGLESLVDGVPLVCKSWYKATLNPLCWQSLFFPTAESKAFYARRRSSMPFSESGCKLYNEVAIEAFAKLVIRRSQGLANVVSIPPAFCISKVTKLIGDGCPSLKMLLLQCDGGDVRVNFSGTIRKWKNLEVLIIYGHVSSLVKIIRQISIHCKKFESLSVIDTDICRSEASVIATRLPNIKFLSFKGSWIYRTEVLTIIKGCRNLVYFDAGKWFESDRDDEINNLAAHITTFKFDASMNDYGDGYARLRGNMDFNFTIMKFIRWDQSL